MFLAFFSSSVRRGCWGTSSTSQNRLISSSRDGLTDLWNIIKDSDAALEGSEEELRLEDDERIGPKMIHPKTVSCAIGFPSTPLRSPSRSTLRWISAPRIISMASELAGFGSAQFSSARWLNVVRSTTVFGTYDVSLGKINALVVSDGEGELRGETKTLWPYETYQGRRTRQRLLKQAF